MQDTNFQELKGVPPMIALAVGRNAVASGPNGTVSGEDVLYTYFRNDLGFESKSIFESFRLIHQLIICWDYMQLGGREKRTG